MKIRILKEELVNYESEFEFFSKVIENYEKEFDNLRKGNGRNMDHPSDTILKIVKLMQHKTQRTTAIFNDMLVICQKEISVDQNQQSEENVVLFTKMLDEFSVYFGRVFKKAKNLKLRIQDLKQKAYGTYEQRGNRNRFNNSMKIEDKGNNQMDNLEKERGMKNLDGILINFET